MYRKLIRTLLILLAVVLTAMPLPAAFADTVGSMDVVSDAAESVDVVTDPVDPDAVPESAEVLDATEDPVEMDEETEPVESTDEDETPLDSAAISDSVDPAAVDETAEASDETADTADTAEVTEPEVTEPEAAEPEATEPEAEEPAAEEPEAEEPADEEPAAGATVLDVEDEIVEDVNLDEENEEIEDYETPLGDSEENTAPVYSYERDENGALVLDENGNPIVTVIEGDEIPVTYLRNEDGELILDEKGDPIPTQTVPTDAIMSNTIVDALNPDRTIDIYYSWNNQKPAIGGDVTFIAVLHGYENLEYSIQWQQSKNGSDWANVPGSNETRYTETITRDNYKDFWRVQVSITGIEELIDRAGQSRRSESIRCG